MTHQACIVGIGYWVQQFGARAVLEAVASACDDTVAANPGKPLGVYASINANILRQALSRMMDAPGTVQTTETMVIRPINGKESSTCQ